MEPDNEQFIYSLQTVFGFLCNFCTGIYLWGFRVWLFQRVNPEYSLEGLMLKSQYSGHLMHMADSLEKTMLGKIEGRRRRGQHRMRRLNGSTDSMDTSLSKLWKIVRHREACLAAVHGVAKSQTWLREWTTMVVVKGHLNSDSCFLWAVWFEPSSFFLCASGFWSVKWGL